MNNLSLNEFIRSRNGKRFFIGRYFFSIVDRIFTVFLDEGEKENIECDILIYYIIYLSLDAVSYKENN